jgi:hypothetical protein
MFQMTLQFTSNSQPYCFRSRARSVVMSSLLQNGAGSLNSSDFVFAFRTEPEVCSTTIATPHALLHRPATVMSPSPQRKAQIIFTYVRTFENMKGYAWYILYQERAVFGKMKMDPAKWAQTQITGEVSSLEWSFPNSLN